MSKKTSVRKRTPGSLHRASVTPTTNHPKKWVECLDCCAVIQLTAFIPLKLSYCSQCGSLKIRLYKLVGQVTALPKNNNNVNGMSTSLERLGSASCRKRK